MDFSVLFQNQQNCIDRILKKDIYEYLIDKCNPVIKHVPAKYIAEFIGITAEWYSKLKR